MKNIVVAYLSALCLSAAIAYALSPAVYGDEWTHSGLQPAEGDQPAREDVVVTHYERDLRAPSNSRTQTRTPSSTRTPTRTRTPSRTPSRTSTSSPSLSSTPSATPTVSQTKTPGLAPFVPCADGSYGAVLMSSPFQFLGAASRYTWCGFGGDEFLEASIEDNCPLSPGSYAFPGLLFNPSRCGIEVSMLQGCGNCCGTSPTFGETFTCTSASAICNPPYCKDNGACVKMEGIQPSCFATFKLVGTTTGYTAISPPFELYLGTPDCLASC